MTDSVEPGLPPDEITIETHGVETTEHVISSKPPTTNAFTVVRKATMRALTWGLVGALIALALTQVAFWIDNQSKNDIITAAQESAADSAESVRELTTDVRLLREQLGEAQEQIERQQVESGELATCRSRFQNAITQAGQEHDLVFDRLVVTLGRVTSTPEEDGQLLDPVYQDIEKASLDWQAAIDARNLWEAAGAPLPCPIEQVVPGEPTTGTG